VIAASGARLGLIAAVSRRSRLAPGVARCSTLASLLGERTTHDIRVGVRVDVEARDSHEHEQDDSARECEGYVVEKETTALTAAGPKRLFGGWRAHGSRSTYLVTGS